MLVVFTAFMTAPYPGIHPHSHTWASAKVLSEEFHFLLQQKSIVFVEVKGAL